MPTALAWYDETGTTPVSASEQVTGAAGVPGTEVALQLINNKGGSGADPMVNARIKALFDDGSGYKMEGTEWADRRYLEARIKTGGVNTNFSLTEWKPIGAQALMDLPILENAEGVVVGFRLNAPSDAVTDQENIRVRVNDSPGEATSAGINELGPGGIYAGLWDAAYTQQVLGGPVVEDSPVSRNVEVPDSVWISKGRAYFAEQQDVNIPNAANGFERWDLLSLDAAGSGTVTKTTGTEISGTVDDDDKPAIPLGDLALAYVKAQDAATQPSVLTGQIENVLELAWYAYSTSSLQFTVTHGPTSLVDNSLIYNAGSQAVGVTDDDTSYIWLNREGVLEATLDEVPPNGRDLLLFEVLAAAGSITSVLDRRLMIGGRLEVVSFEFPAAELLISDIVYLNLHNSRPAWVVPIFGFAMAAGVGTVGGSAGATVLDVEKDDGGWVSLFGTGSTLPQIAYDAAIPVDYFNAIPSDFRLPANCRLRASVSALPTGSTTEATNVTLTMLVFK